MRSGSRRSSLWRRLRSRFCRRRCDLWSYGHGGVVACTRTVWCEPERLLTGVEAGGRCAECGGRRGGDGAEGPNKNLRAKIRWNDADVLPLFCLHFFYSYIRLFTISLFISLFALYFRSLRIFAFGLFEFSSFGRGGLGEIGWARSCNVLRATEALERVC